MITGKRKKVFAREILAHTGRLIGFADVGSGGTLKTPWSNLPGEYLRKFDFEPTSGSGNSLPLCISDHCGIADFHVAHDERASSFHDANIDFARRFGQESIFPKKTIQVACVTLDEYFKDTLDEVDAIDINVEGHDLRVLLGSRQLLEHGFIKLIKIEFELSPVWHGQGWFSEIDAHLRSKGYDLVDVELGYGRPVNVGHFYSKGEPLWGKGYYTPSPSLLRERLAHYEGSALAGHVTCAVALLVAAGLAGRAFDILDMAAPRLKGLDVEQIKARIAHVFAWARIEYGLSHLGHLLSGVSRVLGKRA